MKRTKTRWAILLVSMVVLDMLCGGVAFAQGKVTLRLGHIFPITHPVHKSAMAMADYVAKESKGQLEVKVYSGGALGKGSTLAEKISLGTVEMGTAGPGLLGRMIPAWGLISGEYIFKSLDSMLTVLKGPIGDDLKNRLLTKRGVRTLGIGYLGKRHLTANKPIRRPEDLKGFKIRIPNVPLRKASFVALGASPTPMAFSEVYLALQQGVVDGQENPLAQIVTMKFYEVQKYLILTGHVFNAEILLMNEKKFQSLSKTHQNTLLKGAKVYEESTFEEFKTMRSDLLEKVLDGGMFVMKPDVEAFHKAVKDVPYQFEKKWGKGLYDRILQAQK